MLLQDSVSIYLWQTLSWLCTSIVREVESRTHCRFEGTGASVAETICMWRAKLGVGAPRPRNWRVHIYNYMLPAHESFYFSLIYGFLDYIARKAALNCVTSLRYLCLSVLHKVMRDNNFDQVFL